MDVVVEIEQGRAQMTATKLQGSTACFGKDGDPLWWTVPSPNDLPWSLKLGDGLMVQEHVPSLGPNVTASVPFSIVKADELQVMVAGAGTLRFRRYAGSIAPPARPCEDRFRQMLSEAEELLKVADTLETNREAYEDVVTDILVGGYDSDFARLGIDRISEFQIPALFKDEASKTAARPKLIAKIREKASIRAAIAKFGLARETKQSIAVEDSYTQWNKGEILDYFCSLDANKSTKQTWTALWASGYIDFWTFDEIVYQLTASRIDRALLYASLTQFFAAMAAEPLLFRVINFEAEALTFSVVRARIVESFNNGKFPKAVEFVFKKIPEQPAEQSLTNFQTRVWYRRALKRIGSQLDINKSLEERAHQANELRNVIKLRARTFMIEQEEIAGFESPRTWEATVRNYKSKGFQGNALWREIIEASMRSNKLVDESLGLR